MGLNPRVEKFCPRQALGLPSFALPAPVRSRQGGISFETGDTWFPQASDLGSVDAHDGRLLPIPRPSQPEDLLTTRGPSFLWPLTASQRMISVLQAKPRLPEPAALT